MWSCARLVDKRVLARGNSSKFRVAGKRGGKSATKPISLSGNLIDSQRSGLRVLRLRAATCVFGRGGGKGNQRSAAAGVPFRIIPGGSLPASRRWRRLSSPPRCARQWRQIIFAAGHGADDDTFDWGPRAPERRSCSTW
jgi:uroporphyrin-III C-methyltransferase